METDEDRIKSKLYIIAGIKIRKDAEENNEFHLGRIIEYVEREYLRVRYGFSAEPTDEEVEKLRFHSESVESYETEIADRVNKRHITAPSDKPEESLEATTEFLKRNRLGVRLRRLFARGKKEKEDKKKSNSDDI